jgi:hypothetical protein
MQSRRMVRACGGIRLENEAPAVFTTGAFRSDRRWAECYGPGGIVLKSPHRVFAAAP